MTTGEFNTWRKASYSAGDSNCVEVGAGPQAWRKASYSTGNSECVEVGAGRWVIGVRDTQQQRGGPVLEFPATAWRAFIDTARAERL